MTRTPEVYDLICSLGELIDKLSIENIKCYDANQRVLEERRLKTPDASKIADWEWQARRAGEQRVKLRDEINQRLAEAIGRGGIRAAPEARTYRLEDV
jgi:hypothetical protein